MLAAALSLFGIGKSYIEGKQRIALQKNQAVADMQIQDMQNGASWASVVAQRSSRYLRWACAAHLFAGLDFTIYLALKGDPNPGVIFEAFELLPDWYAGLLMTMFAWAFASDKLRQAGGALAGKWKKRTTK
jgi:hypothetical protein